MRFTGSAWIAGISLLGISLAGGAAAECAKRPRYGGTLRVELQAAKISIDPREWRAGMEEAAAAQKLAALVFDRLLSLDDYGRIQPQLAAAWSHDAAFKRWQFTIRSGVKFTDGTLLSAAEAATALRALLPAKRQVSGAGDSLVLQSPEAMPELLEELASPKYVVFHVGSGGALAGTGPFVAVDGAPAGHLLFRANEECWAGRPFVDAVDVALGVPPLRRLYDLQLRRAELIELPADLVRRANDVGLRTWTSAPVRLYALRFDESRPGANEPRLREAVSQSLDRATMASVLLQKQGEPAAALLPQWLSGYASLFTVENDPARAKALRADLPANVASAAEPLRLRVDAPGDMAKLLGERVAVNARQSQWIVQSAGHAAARAAAGSEAARNEPAPDLRLIVWRYGSLSASAEMESLAAGQELGDASGSNSAAEGPERLYERERRLLEERRVTPLVLLPEFVGIGANVRDWMPARWGEWRLADVWLDTEEPASPPKAGGAQP